MLNEKLENQNIIKGVISIFLRYNLKYHVILIMYVVFV